MNNDAFGLLSDAPAMQELCRAIEDATCDEDLEPFMHWYAVLFTDLSGFSTYPFLFQGLQRVLRMEQTLHATLETCKGLLLKPLGDSHLFLYESVDRAIACIDATRIALPNNQFCVGIGWGKVIPCVHDNGRLDAFGLEVSLASRLGEDIASGSQVLLSDSAYKQLDDTVAARCISRVNYRIPCWELQPSARRSA